MNKSHSILRNELYNELPLTKNLQKVTWRCTNIFSFMLQNSHFGSKNQLHNIRYLHCCIVEKAKSNAIT